MSSIKVVDIDNNQDLLAREQPHSIQSRVGKILRKNQTSFTIKTPSHKLKHSTKSILQYNLFSKPKYIKINIPKYLKKSWPYLITNKVVHPYMQQKVSKSKINGRQRGYPVYKVAPYFLASL